MSEIILAIESSTPACSAALSIDGEVLERYALAPRQHAALLLPMIESLLLEADVTVASLHAIAFGRGPGSFTGVRIAASMVQGIAFAADLQVLPVSTLAALALGGMREASVCRVITAMDARKAEIYTACYQQIDGAPIKLLGEERVCAPDAMDIPDQHDWAGVGGGWQAYGKDMIQHAGDRVTRLMPDLEPRASDVARLALHDFQQGRSVSAEQAIPVYLRNNVAVEKIS